MDSAVSGEVRELMEYEDDVVGSLMMTDHIRFRASDTVGAAAAALREQKPEYDMLYCLYVLSEEDTIEGTLSLRDIVLSDPEVKIGDIMNRDVVCVRDTDRIDALNDTIAKYNLLAVPVVDDRETLQGTVIINDAFFRLLRTRRKLI